MRKLLMAVGAVVALAIPATAIAVVGLQASHVGLGCSEGGTFHFVAPGGGASSRLTVDFSGGGDVTSMTPTKWNRGTAHWWIDASGTISSASATNARRLVLSDYECDEKKSEPEPDPKR